MASKSSLTGRRRVATMSRDNKVKLQSSDDQIFEVEEVVAYKFDALKSFFEGTMGTGIAIPLNNISGEILSKVIEYCRYQVESQKTSDVPVPEHLVKQWNTEFILTNVALIVDLSRAACQLGVKNLVDLIAGNLANCFRHLDEVLGFLNIQHHFTPEERERMRID